MRPGLFRINFSLCVVLTILAVSCYTRKEGCLDTLAANFDVTADDPCGQCCIFPSLSLEVTHNAGDTLLNTKAIYTNQLNQKYQILDIRYYLSGFVLSPAGQPNVRIREVIQNNTGSVIEYNDMHICRIADKVIKVGTVRSFGRFDTLSFDLGLSDKVLSNEFTGLPSDHVLLKNNRLNDEAGNIVFATLKYVHVKPDKRDTINLSFGASSDRFDIRVDSTLVTQKGSHIIYRLKTDYLKILIDADLDKSPENIKTTAGKNLRAAIGVR